jgi:hypothetical protein
LFLWSRRAGADEAEVVFSDFGKNDQAQPAIRHSSANKNQLIDNNK